MGQAEPGDETELMRGLQDLLLKIAHGYSPNRLSSVLYMHNRELLLQSKLAGVLPGFLTQCVSVARFRIFIELYDCASDEREAFIHAALAPAWKILRTGRSGRSYDFLDDVF